MMEMERRVERTGVVVLNKPRKLFLILILGHFFWVHFALLNKPGAKFGPLGKDATRNGQKT
jgi:hypothetical protein